MQSYGCIIFISKIPISITHELLILLDRCEQHPQNNSVYFGIVKQYWECYNICAASSQI